MGPSASLAQAPSLAQRYFKANAHIFAALRALDVHIKTVNRFRALAYAIRAMGAIQKAIRQTAAGARAAGAAAVTQAAAEPKATPTEMAYAAKRARGIALEMAFHHEAQGDYSELAFQMDSQGGAAYSKKEYEAAGAFDARHRTRVSAAQKQLVHLRFRPASLDGQRNMHHAELLVRNNHYVVRERYDPFAEARRERQGAQRVAKRVIKKHWALEESVWVPRRTTGNSKDFFENAESLRRMLCTDWRVAARHQNLQYYIAKVSLTGQLSRQEEVKDLLKKPSKESDDRPSVNADSLSVEAMKEVEAVQAVLIRHSRILYGAFDQYSLISHFDPVVGLLDGAGKKISKIRDAVTRLDLHSVSRSAFFRFVSDCDLQASHCTRSDIESILLAVNSEDAATAKEDAHNRKSFLNRHEWLQVIVRIAVRVYCRYNGGNFSGSVSEAVDRLCNENLLPNLPREALENSNVFRKTHCYTAPVDGMLKKHEAALWTLYNCYASLDTTGYSWQDERQLVDKKLMSVGEWLEFVTDIGLIEMELITIPMALQCFQWSRIRSLADYSDRSELLLRAFHFEDFLEAFVRLASVIAFPTRAELDEADCTDVAEFLHALRRDQPTRFSEHLQRRTLSWFERPRQRTHILVGFLFDLALHNVNASLVEVARERDPTSNAAPPSHRSNKRQISSTDAARFAEYRMAGGLLTHGEISVDGGELVAAMQRSETQIMDALRQVPAFEALNEPQLKTLRAAMSVAKFDDGERVFDQGDEGDAFYLITTGHCDVLWYDPAICQGEQGGEERLARLHQSDCFGERALLYDEPRAASIRAGPGCRLYVVFIRRDHFERALGKSLADFQKLKKSDPETVETTEPEALE